MKKNTRIMYLRDKDRRPVGCVAMHLHSKRRTARFQVSTLNPVDEFDRAFARQLALGRMVDSPELLRSENGFNNMFELTVSIMRRIADGKSYPARARRAAQSWLSENS